MGVEGIENEGCFTQGHPSGAWEEELEVIHRVRVAETTKNRSLVLTYKMKVNVPKPVALTSARSYGSSLGKS